MFVWPGIDIHVHFLVDSALS